MADSEHGLTSRLSPRWIATGVVAGGVVLLAIWLRFGLIGGQTWPVNWLDVVGDLQRTTSGQVRAAVMPHAERGFFAVDLAEVRAAVAALPWVAEASVRRVWPDTLEVRVVEHRPVARWNESDLLSQHGEVFTVNGAGALQGLPHLVGPDIRLDEVVSAWKGMRDILAGSGGEIRRIDLDARGAWEVELDSGTTLRLGREQVMPRLKRYAGVARQLAGVRDGVPRIVDLRYPNGLAVRWPEGGAPGTEDSEEATSTHG